MTSEETVNSLGPMFPFVAADVALALDSLGLSSSAVVLDVGTGAGFCAIALALQGHRVITGEPETDSSHYAGKDWSLNAEKLGVLEKIRFQAFNAAEMPFEPAQFEAVFFFGVLHHIDEGLRKNVLVEALRVVKQGGAVVFFEPKRSTLEKIWVSDPGHPPAANPSEYLPSQKPLEERLSGDIMEVYLYRNAPGGE